MTIEFWKRKLKSLEKLFSFFFFIIIIIIILFRIKEKECRKKEFLMLQPVLRFGGGFK